MSSYSLGSGDLEIKRLDQQSSWLEEPTRLLLRLAGIERGMRVLDLGTGLGHVAFALADLVGRAGQVVGLDRDERMIAAASARAGSRSHVHFTKGDVLTWTCAESFDAIVGRLILFHLPDAVAAVRHHLAHLRPGAQFVAIDYDIGACRAEPPAALIEPYRQRVIDAFRSAGADPMVGTRLASILADAGLAVTQSIGMQGYIAPDDPRGAAMLAGVVRSLAPQMAAAGITTIAELDLETLQDRLAAAFQATRSVLLPPTLVGAWGRLPEQR
jgi:ubiquinone/menaquinone biosynthesis C-methylase UbiE